MKRPCCDLGSSSNRLSTSILGKAWRLKLRAGSDSGVSPGAKEMQVDSFWSVHLEYLREGDVEGGRKSSRHLRILPTSGNDYQFLLTASVPVDLPVKCLQRQVP